MVSFAVLVSSKLHFGSEDVSAFSEREARHSQKQSQLGIFSHCACSVSLPVAYFENFCEPCTNQFAIQPKTWAHSKRGRNAPLLGILLEHLPEKAAILICGCLFKFSRPSEERASILHYFILMLAFQLFLRQLF